MNEKRMLVAFFSRAGDNYVGGRIAKLAVGNTEVAARTIQALTGADLFRIDTTTPYPVDYEEATKVAQSELRKNARPTLSGTIDKLGDYGVVFLGYPNWWGTMPMAVFAFLESHDFSGATIVPFCTHEGSGLGRSEGDIRRLCPAAAVLPGIAIPGSGVTKAAGDIAGWLRRLKLVE